MVETSRTLIGISALALLVVFSGCLGLTGDTNTQPEVDTTSPEPIPEKQVPDKIHGTISGESLDGYEVKVSVIAENKSAYRCSVSSLNKQIPNATKVDALSLRPTDCNGVYVKAITMK
jgi:hypothetical protein